MNNQEEWTKDDRYSNVYYCIKKFDSYFYCGVMTIEETEKSIKYWFSVSSGKKKKDLEIFEEKDSKSKGGLKALLWLKSKMFDFPEYFDKSYGRKEYICVAWADSKRRDIYERLKEEGFEFAMQYNSKILMKKL